MIIVLSKLSCCSSSKPGRPSCRFYKYSPLATIRTLINVTAELVHAINNVEVSNFSRFVAFDILKEFSTATLLSPAPPRFLVRFHVATRTYDSQMLRRQDTTGNFDVCCGYCEYQPRTAPSSSITYIWTGKKAFSD